MYLDVGPDAIELQLNFFVLDEIIRKFRASFYISIFLQK